MGGGKGAERSVLMLSVVSDGGRIVQGKSRAEWEQCTRANRGRRSELAGSGEMNE